MATADAVSNIAAPTQFLTVKNEKYGYLRFGRGAGLPLLCLQHFTGTLDNWDPTVTDALAERGEVILFESAGIGRSSGKVPTTVAGMAKHALAFLDGLGIKICDVLGFSLGGMVAQQMVLDRSSIFRRMILVGTAPRGGKDIMHLDKPVLAKPLQDPSLKGYARVAKDFLCTELNRAKLPAKPSSVVCCSVKRTGNPSPGLKWHKRRWRRFGIGRNMQANVSLTWRRSVSRRSS